jgi:hypothetical protein
MTVRMDRSSQGGSEQWGFETAQSHRDHLGRIHMLSG